MCGVKSRGERHLSSRSVGGCSPSSVAAATKTGGFPLSAMKVSHMHCHRSSHAISRCCGTGFASSASKYGKSGTDDEQHARAVNVSSAVTCSAVVNLLPASKALCSASMHAVESTVASADSASPRSGS